MTESIKDAVAPMKEDHIYWNSKVDPGLFRMLFEDAVDEYLSRWNIAIPDDVNFYRLVLNQVVQKVQTVTGDTRAWVPGSRVKCTVSFSNDVTKLTDKTALVLHNNCIMAVGDEINQSHRFFDKMFTRKDFSAKMDDELKRWLDVAVFYGVASFRERFQ